LFVSRLLTASLTVLGLASQPKLLLLGCEAAVAIPLELDPRRVGVDPDVEIRATHGGFRRLSVAGQTQGILRPLLFCSNSQFAKSPCSRRSSASLLRDVVPMFGVFALAVTPPYRARSSLFITHRIDTKTPAEIRRIGLCWQIDWTDNGNKYGASETRIPIDRYRTSSEILKGRAEHAASHFSNRCHHRGTHQSQVSEFHYSQRSSFFSEF
jgi:hypothetical protein